MSPFPFADERALGRAALIAGVGIDGPRALRRPAHDLDLAARRIVDEKTVALERRRGRVDHAHGDACQVRRQIGIEIVDGVRHGVCPLAKSSSEPPSPAAVRSTDFTPARQGRDAYNQACTEHRPRE
jgi:hypothetical protein